MDTPASKPHLHHIHKVPTEESVWKKKRERTTADGIGDSEARHKICACKFKNIYFIPSQDSNPPR